MRLFVEGHGANPKRRSDFSGFFYVGIDDLALGSFKPNDLNSLTDKGSNSSSSNLGCFWVIQHSPGEVERAMRSKAKLDSVCREETHPSGGDVFVAVIAELKHAAGRSACLIPTSGKST